MMDREQGKEFAKVLEHWSNGGVIQGRHDCCDWVTIDNNRFFPEMGVEYRIAPKPLECWVWVYPDGNWENATFKDKEDCDVEFLGQKGKAIHMREVTDG